MLLRLAVGPDQPIDRTCAGCGEPHGRPRLPGSGRHVSVTHSGELAAVAITGAGPVGIDVEAMRSFDHAPLLAEVLHPEERAPGLREFFGYWTRKESVLKATGQGLAIPMRELVVTAPGEPPRLLRYPGDPLDARMADLELAPGYVGAATVLTPGPVRFRTQHARDRLNAVAEAPEPGGC